MKVLYSIFFGLFTLSLMGVAGVFLAPLLPIDHTVEIMIVESGSMEPAISTGSLVFVVPAANYAQNDVITFESTAADVPTTHRIVGIEEQGGTQWFTTKGDANEEPDTEATPKSSIIGKVLLTVPYAGFILDFARQPLGFALLIVLPALLIIFGEIENIWKEIRKKKGTKTAALPKIEARAVEVDVREIVRMIEINRPIVFCKKVPRTQELTLTAVPAPQNYPQYVREVAASVLIVALSFGFASLGLVGSTVSYFNDTEGAQNNTLKAQALDFIVNADGGAFGFVSGILDDLDGALVTVVSPDAESTDMSYRLHVEKFAGSDLFCAAITADVVAPFVYAGQLMLLDQAPVEFDGAWSLSLSLDDAVVGYVSGDECIVDLVYTAWNADVAQGEGYSDEERVRLEFHAPVVPLQLQIPSSEPEALLELSTEGGIIEEETESEEEEHDMPEDEGEPAEIDEDPEPEEMEVEEPEVEEEIEAEEAEETEVEEPEAEEEIGAEAPETIVETV